MPESINLYIFSITSFELYPGGLDSEKLDDIQKVTSNIQVLNFDEETAQISAEIYLNLGGKNKIIDYRDIFIAATCINITYHY